MAAINVPERYRRSLVTVRDLPEEAVNELWEALRKAPRKADPEEIAAAVAKNVRLPSEQAEPLIEALASLYMFRSYADASLEDAIQGVVLAVGAIDGRTMDATSIEVLRERLQKLLSIDTLQTTFKAVSLAVEHDHVFSLAKVISDIRPVFATDLDRPVCAVIVHTLNLHYYQAGEHQEFRVALDGEDLKNLRAAIDRAERKAESLKKLLDKAGVVCQEME